MSQPTFANIAITLGGAQQTLIAEAKVFKTGSRGFHGNGKMVDPETGKRYQANCMLIEIGSKLGTPAKKNGSKK
jgi:hypothetical protein